MYQLKLLFKQNRETLKDYIENATGKTITLNITDNTASMISFREKRHNEILVRLHWMFLHADNDVIREIAAFIRDKKSHTPLVGTFIRENRNRIRTRVKSRAINVQGKYYNLRDIFIFLNKEYFNDGLKVFITWGNQRCRWYKGKRTLGSYDKTTNMIRINPLLDKKVIPKYFVEFIVYHEMIHADMQSRKEEARRLVHTNEFKSRERLFEQYKKAIQWEKRHFG